jgi:hypothetical protein
MKTMRRSHQRRGLLLCVVFVMIFLFFITFLVENELFLAHQISMRIVRTHSIAILIGRRVIAVVIVLENTIMNIILIIVVIVIIAVIVVSNIIDFIEESLRIEIEFVHHHQIIPPIVFQERPLVDGSDRIRTMLQESVAVVIVSIVVVNTIVFLGEGIHVGDDIHHIRGRGEAVLSVSSDFLVGAGIVVLILGGTRSEDEGSHGGCPASLGLDGESGSAHSHLHGLRVRKRQWFSDIDHGSVGRTIVREEELAILKERKRGEKTMLKINNTIISRVILLT